MKVVAGGSDHEFENCPAGTHIGVCYGVVDLGTQSGKFGDKHEVRIYWEVHCDEKMSDGRPFGVNERYSLSLHEKANLRRDLESWRGKPFESMEAFEMKNIIGAPCMLNIVHTHKDDSTYADVKAIMALPKGTPKPEMINEPIFVSLVADEFDVSAYDRLSDRMKETVAKSPEYQSIVGDRSGTVTMPPQEVMEGDDPNIPF